VLSRLKLGAGENSRQLERRIPTPSSCQRAGFDREALRGEASGSGHNMEVAVSDNVRSSKLRTTLSAAEMSPGPELQRDFAIFLLRASFVALTAGMFFVWLAISN
jgi:hypothetical protein